MHVLTMTFLEEERKGKGNEDSEAMAVDEIDRFNEAIEMQSKITRAAYDSKNSCPVCMCELFAEPSFSNTAIVQLANQQE